MEKSRLKIPSKQLLWIFSNREEKLLVLVYNYAVFRNYYPRKFFFPNQSESGNKNILKKWASFQHVE